MANTNGRKEQSEAAAAQDSANGSVTDKEPVVSKPYVMPDDPEEGSVEALTKEVAEAKDRMLRTLAEMENLRKRTQREVTDARTYGITAFARDVLDIADNLQRALDAVPMEAREA
ncbi:MAG: nucleotide exchange factor GrpE, partial [Afipia sp.]|nr:nucleotide exchange factor GrpE [Afipia sp.]